MASHQSFIDKVAQHKIVAISRGTDPDALLPAAKAVVAGGIRLFELTFEQANPNTVSPTAESIRRLSVLREYGVSIGAGTVMTVEQLRAAKDAGAEFILSPNLDAEVLKAAVDMDMPTVIGAMTPSEVAEAYHLGADIVKVFPAGLFGTAYIKALRGPMNHIPLMAVGNIDADNVASFLAAGCMSAGIGSSLMNGKLIREGQFDQLTALAKSFMERV